MASPWAAAVIDAMKAVDFETQRVASDAQNEDVLRLLRTASRMICWRRKAESWVATINLVASVVSKHPRMLADEIEHWVLLGLDRVNEETTVRRIDNGRIGIHGNETDVMEKLLVRQAAAWLAVRLFRWYRDERKSIPEEVKEWEETCRSTDEFAEVRNQWIGAVSDD